MARTEQTIPNRVYEDDINKYNDFRYYSSYTVFCKKNVCKKMRLKMAKILRKSQDSVSKIKYFCWPKIDIASLLHSKCVKYRIQIRI